jgi:hypothetical protein
LIKETRSPAELSSAGEEDGNVSPDQVRPSINSAEPLGSQEYLSPSATDSQQHLVYENKAYDQEDKMSTTEDGTLSVQSESLLPGAEEDDVRNRM